MENLDYRDPAMVGSSFVRARGDTYWTENWITRALLSALEAEGLHVLATWEPACGRGDMVRVLRADGHMGVSASDVDLSHYREGLAVRQDFLSAPGLPPELANAHLDRRGIITNPPYYRLPGTRRYMTDLFVTHALSMDVAVVAMLMRSTWKCADSRRHFFEQQHLDKRFHMEVVLTSRPRWDDWENHATPEKAGPRHDYSWYVWSTSAPAKPTILWRGKA